MRCVLCGSKEVSLVNKSSYSMKKGIAGAAVLGPVGAVAGINGNSSMVYHCMKCGQDSLSIMDSYIEQAIDDALCNGDKEKLDGYRSSWKNIEYSSVSRHDTIFKRESDDHRKENEANILSSNIQKEDRPTKQLSNVGLMREIKTAVANSVVPYSEEELIDTYSTNTSFNNVYSSMLQEGSLHRLLRKGKCYIQAASNFDDMDMFALMASAELDNRNDIKDIEEFLHDLKEIIKNNCGLEKNEIQDAIAKKHPEYVIPDNPYSVSSLVDSGLLRLLNNKEINYSRTGYYIVEDDEKYEQYVTGRALHILELKKRRRLGSYLGPTLDDIQELHKTDLGKELLDKLASRIGEKLTFDQILDIVNEGRMQKIDKKTMVSRDSSEDTGLNLFVELLYYEQRKMFEHIKEDGRCYWIYQGA